MKASAEAGVLVFLPLLSPLFKQTIEYEIRLAPQEGPLVYLTDCRIRSCGFTKIIVHR